MKMPTKSRSNQTQMEKSQKQIMDDKKRRSTVGDYFRLQRGTTYKSRLLGQPGPVLLGLASIRRNGGFRTDSLRTYGGESPNKLLVQPGEIYVSLKDVTQSADLLGAVARLPYGHLAGRLTQDTVKLVQKSDDVPLDYLYWLLRTPQYRAYCRTYATGTTNLGLSREDFLAFPAPEPKAKQLLLVDTLEALKEKIELNLKMNKTLEAVGEVVFRQWFVDFEFPNHEGKPYKSSGGKMVYNDYFDKTIPVDWKLKKIGEILTTVLGGTPDRRNPEYWDGDIPWINSGKINEFRIIEPSEYITEKGLENSATTLLPRRTTVIAITGATLGQVSLLEIDSCANQSVVGVLESQEIPSEYIYFWIKQTIQQIIAWQTGGAQQHINKNNVNDSLLLIPDQKMLSAYLNFVQPLFNRITINCFENLSLRKIRRLLLPKLVSGKIKVEAS